MIIMLECKRAGRPSNKPTMAELDMMYQHMTAKELANHYGVAEVTVKKWIYRYRKELKRKDKVEAQC